jgi:hypothetical protein
MYVPFQSTRGMGDHRAVTQESPPTARSPEWAAAALAACLRALDHDDAALGLRLVNVRDAWLEGGQAMCVVYSHIWFPEGDLGLRRTFEEDAEAEEEEKDDDPDHFGSDVALYDILEPLGSVANHLRADEFGVQWWGALDEQLPRKPIV